MKRSRKAHAAATGTGLVLALLLPVSAAAQQQGGDDCTSATVLAGPLPIHAGGTTVGYRDHYDEVCPYVGPSSPDVVYAYTPQADVAVDVLLCNGGTDFDTRLYIYDSCPPTPGRPVACNDDACTTPAMQGYVSGLWNVWLTGGVTYYVVVDGYDGAQGYYELDILPSFPSPECPAGAVSMLSQPPDLELWTLFPADVNWTSSVLTAESFRDLSERISGVRFWGLPFTFQTGGGGGWRQCQEDPMPFEIVFYEDAGGQPGAEFRRYTLNLLGFVAGNVGYPQYDLYEYTAELDPPCSLKNGWISIRGADGPNCWFAWTSSAHGDGLCRTKATLGWSVGRFDLALCLLTDGGPATGACCNDMTGSCTENVELRDCAGRFMAAGTCASFSPPCGQATGACCRGNGTCAITTFAACQAVPACPGDLNCDALVDFGDINPFVWAIANPAYYVSQFPNCLLSNGDINGDGRVDFGDIDGFIGRLGKRCNHWLGVGSMCGQCSVPGVLLPYNLPFTNTNFTCGRGNKFDATCLGPDDVGEDIVYELIVAGEPLAVEIRLEPKLSQYESIYTGLLLDRNYPPEGDCVASSTQLHHDYNNLPNILTCRRLAPGAYYLLIDTFPADQCLTEFTLKITACTPAVGRCCYGDPVQCLDTTAAQCALLSGTWQANTTCATPCPPLDGEDCAHAWTVPSVPYSVQFDNAAMKADGPAAACDKYAPPGPMANDAWFAWTAAADGLATLDVAVAYDVVVAVYDGCGEPKTLACADLGGVGAPERLEFAAHAGQTYYLQVGAAGTHATGGLTTLDLTCATGVGACCLPDGRCQEVTGFACLGMDGRYQGAGTTCAATSCPQPTPGDNCDDPLDVQLTAAGLPFSDVNHTAGRGDDYRNTCLAVHDSGEDMVYRLTVLEPLVVNIVLDPKGTSDTGFLLADDCPPDDHCILSRWSAAGSAYRADYVVLLPGVYYLMIDKWLTPAGIDEFELRIENADLRTGACCLGSACVPDLTLAACLAQGGEWFVDRTCAAVGCPGAVGDSCLTPHVVNLAPPSPSYTRADTTCNRGNGGAGIACLHGFDGGQDTVYKLVVSGGAVRVNISLDEGTGGAGQLRMALSETCPPNGDCLTGRHVLRDVRLEPGVHYLWIDSWPVAKTGGGWTDCQPYTVYIARSALAP